MNTMLTLLLVVNLDQSFLSSEILPSNYTIFRKDRTLGGGGVFIGIKNYLTAIPYHTTSSNAEILWIKLLLKITQHMCALSIDLRIMTLTL